ncbi:MAG: autotransporter-associated beta strand repeat-containing protein [Rubrivivax sp.]
MSGSSVVIEGSNTDGALTIDGPDASLQTAGQILVGIGGSANASVTLSNRATISDVNILAIGFAASSGSNTLTIQDGSTVSNIASAVGVSSGAVGGVTLRDQGSSWTTDFLALGGYSAGQQGGTGTVSVTNDASLVVGGELRFFTAASSLTVNRATLRVGGLASDAGIAPTVRIRNPGSSTALTIDSPANTSFTFNGVIADDGSAGGIVKRGPGEQIFTAQQTYTGGTRVEAGTLTLGTHDTLVPTSVITLAGGTLNLQGNTQRTGTFTLGGGTVVGSATSLLLPATLNLQSGTLAAPVVSSGAVTKTTAGSVSVSTADRGNARCQRGHAHARQGRDGRQRLGDRRHAPTEGCRRRHVVERGSSGTVALVGPAIFSSSASLAGPLNVAGHARALHRT